MKKIDEIREKFNNEIIQLSDTKYFIAINHDGVELLMGILDEDEEGVCGYICRGGENFGIKNGTITSCPNNSLKIQYQTKLATMLSIEEAKEKYDLVDGK